MKNKKLFISASLTVGLLALGAVLFDSFITNQPKGKVVSELYSLKEITEMYPADLDEEKNEHRYIKDAMAYVNRMRATDPNTGYLDFSKMLAAKNAVKLAANKRSSGSVTWEELGPDNVGGRTRDIWIDPTNSNHLLTGGVTGGLFVSNDAAASWSPHPLNDEFTNLSISSIVRASNGDIYVGTGESWVGTQQNGFGTFNGHIGNGIYKSTDNGNTFEQLASTAVTLNEPSENFAFINELAVQPIAPQTVYACTQRGLFISFDGGATFGNTPLGLAVGDQGKPATDIVIASDGIVHLIQNNKYYRSDAGGVTFSLGATSGFPTSNISRIELDLSPQDNNYVYAAIANSNDGLRGVYRSVDGGVNWSAYSPENSNAFNPLGFQGSYDLAFAVSPVNKDKVYLGGQFAMVAGGNSIGWLTIAFWQPQSFNNPYYIHADMHVVKFDPNNSDIMYVGSDGGINKTTNASENQPTFTTRNKGYNVTQFYDIAAGISGEVLAGSQDNGTNFIDYQGNTRLSGLELYGGDGGSCAVSKLNPLAMFSETPFGECRRSSNGGESWGSFFDDFASSFVGEGRGTLFIAPFDLYETWDTSINANNDTIINPKGIFMIGTANYVAFTLDALNFGTDPVWYRLPISGTVSSVTASRSGKFYIGTTGGNAYVISGLLNATYNPGNNVVTGVTPKLIGNNPDWGGGSRYVTSVVPKEGGDDTLVVTLAGYSNEDNIFLTYNANAASPTFNSIQNDLPSMPVYDAVIDYYTGAIFAATDYGVWSRQNGTTTWQLENQGLNTTPVYSLKEDYLYEGDCRVIYAASYGRGAYRTTTLTAQNRPSCKLEQGATSTGKPMTLKTLNVYPNPMDNIAFVEVSLTKSANVNIVIYDILGRVQKQTSFGKLEGNQKLQMNLEDVPCGNYILSVQTDGKATSKPIVVLK
ncbi:MAG: T9SS type A sorting domain-containing protein [Chitinophagales bacterium]|nr:T9SS type A sorting domain-containing protein [Chitinophagales bacterium]